MPKLDLAALPQIERSGYPNPHHEVVAGRLQRRLGPAAAFTLLGATQVVLKPGAWSAQRHWHHEVDELVVMIAGEAVLVEDEAETVLRAGDVAAWPKGRANGHCLQNRSAADCTFIAISAGDHANDRGEYPDIDLRFSPQGFTRKDGTPYPRRG